MWYTPVYNLVFKKVLILRGNCENDYVSYSKTTLHILVFTQQTVIESDVAYISTCNENCFLWQKGGKHKSLKKLRLTSDRKFVLLFEWIRKSRKLKIVSNEILLLNQNSRRKITKIKICHMEIIHKDIFFINFSDIFFCL